MLERSEHKKIITQSQNRCIKMGLCPDMIYSKKIISGHDLDNLTTKNRTLIKLAEPFMKQLNDFVQSSDFLTILTDNEGCILRIYGSDRILQEASKLKMIPGAYMSEEHIGTNAMGTVLVEDKPLQLVSTDHFIKAYHRWTCSCAPIHNPEGKLIGSLDLTGNTSFVHTHTLGMVVAAAYALENTLSINMYQTQLIKSKNNMVNIFNSIPAGIITSDLSGNIKFHNDHFMELFGLDKHSFQTKKIWDFFEGWNSVVTSLHQRQPFLDEDVYVTSYKNLLQLNLSAYPMYDFSNDLEEIIFVFKDVKKVRKLANRIMGRKAIYTFDKIVTQNKEFLNIIEFAMKVADSKSTILITGESGTGKEIIAQSIHNYSNRKNESFIAVNCGAIPKTLIESELFGYVEGAFTGAKRGGNPGKFEIADGGTIFLDEIGEMPLDMQANLLRVIEESYLTRIGSSLPIPVNIRIIAATNRDLKQEVDGGNFRTDLYYRLNVLPIHLPPLRQRVDDIPLLLDYFMGNFSKRLNKKLVKIPEASINNLMRYSWPGNIRELENFVELIINTEKIPITLETKNSLDPGNFISNEDHILNLKELEKQHIIYVLKKTSHNIMQTAKFLGISRNTLYRKMEEYSISAPY